MKSIFLALLLMVAGVQSFAQAIAEPDRTILLNLYNSTNGAGWTNSTNWNTATYPWYGVTVDAAGHVTKLELANNNLNGALTDFAGLVNLNKLLLSVNNLTGSLPANLNSLTNLQYFNVSGNQLSGAIPSLTGLTNLQTFIVGVNSLSGSLPDLAGLVNLKMFHASNNQLSGTIPPLTGLTNLEDYNISVNNFTGNLPALTGLANLKYFNCNFTQVTGSLPSFAGLINLVYFNVNNNQLDGTIPADLNQATNLVQFFIFSNKLTGTFPSLYGLSSLQRLWIDHNQFTGNFPALAGQQLNSINQIIANVNQFTGAVPAVTGLNSLQEFYFNFNNFTSFENFVKPAALKEWYIHTNYINFDSFDNLTDPATINALKTIVTFWYNSQNVPVTITKNVDVITTNLAEGQTPANYTYHWRKKNATTDVEILAINGSNSVTTAQLAAAGLAGGDDLYVIVTHNTYTITTPVLNGMKGLFFTSNILSTPLPVTFGTIQAFINNGNLLVNWQSLTETNNDHFDIEISTDGKTFTKIGTVASTAKDGTSTTTTDYSFNKNIAGTMAALLLPGLLLMGVQGISSRKKTALYTAVIASLIFLHACNKKDADIKNATNSTIYVRISQVDKDGTKVYSKAIKVIKE